MKILVTVITSLGRFEGRLEYSGELNLEGAVELVESVSQSINGLERLAIRHDDGTETVFSQAVLAGAILRLKVEEETDK